MAEELLKIKIIGDAQGAKPVIKALVDIGALDEKNAKQFEKNSNKLKKQQQQAGGIINKLERDLQRLQAARKRAWNPQQITAFNKAIKKTETRLKGLQGQTSSLIKQVALLGGGFSAAFAIQRIVSGAIKTIREFDEAIADLRKTTGLSDVAARSLAKELGRIDTRSSVFELLKLATAAGRLGIAQKDIKGFVEQTDKAFVALADDLGGSAEEIATDLGRIAGVFGIEEAEGISEAINIVGSVLNELGANTKANAGFISDFVERMGGIAPQAGISFSAIAGLGATLQELGQSAETSSTTLAKLIPAIGKDIPKFAGVAGLSIKEFSKILKEDANEALLQVFEGAQSTTGGVAGLAKTLEELGIDSGRAAGVVGVLSANIDRVRRNQALASEEAKVATSLTNEFNIKNNTLNATLEKVSNSYDKMILSIEDGSGAISESGTELASLTKTVLNLITAFNDGSDASTIFADFALNNMRKLGIVTEEEFTKINKVVEDNAELLNTAGISQEEIRESAINLAKATGVTVTEAYSFLTQKLIAYQKQLQESKDSQDETTDSTDALADALDALAGDKALNTIKAIKEQIAELKKLRDVTDINSEKFRELTRTITELESRLPKTTKKTKEQKDAMDLLKESISDLNKELQLQALAGDIDEKTVLKLNEATGLLEKAQKELNIALGEEPEGLKNLKKARIEAAKEHEEIAEREIKAIQTFRENELNDIINNEDKRLDVRIMALETLRDQTIENTNLTETETLNIIADTEKKITKLKIDELKKQDDADKKTADDRKARQERALSSSIDAANRAFNIINALTNAQTIKVENAHAKRSSIIEKANKEEQESLKKLLTSEAIDREEFSKRKEILDSEFIKRREKLDEETNKKRRELMRKQAITDKATAIFNATINTAASVTAALEFPPLAIAIGILGAAEIAVIAATPIPEFAKGTKSSPEGWAMVGEKGKERTYLEKGTKVIPADKSKKYAAAVDAMIDNNFDSWVVRNYAKEPGFAGNVVNSMEYNFDTHPITKRQNQGNRLMRENNHLLRKLTSRPKYFRNGF